MSQPRDPSAAPHESAPRRPYAAPVLRTYGALRSLTASGTGAMAENMITNQPTKKMA